uniref:Uncharacterized protein n=1 Tax=Arundo donax TaxID=35708 RepID=A0A0A9CSK8_ARUDO
MLAALLQQTFAGQDPFFPCHDLLSVFFLDIHCSNVRRLVAGIQLRRRPCILYLQQNLCSSQRTFCC